LIDDEPWSTVHRSSSIIVEVADTGIGIPAEYLPQLFSRFHRGRNSATYPGSGLGLTIVWAIMARHDGNVAVTSSPAGTCFTLGWPRGGAEVDPEALRTSL